MNLQLNDPTVPSPGEMVHESQSTVRSASPQPFSGGSPLLGGAGDPHHRAPSLGELHQELEAEQEAQVVGPGRDPLLIFHLLFPRTNQCAYRIVSYR